MVIASEHNEPRLTSGADIPSPRKDRKDSRNMADGRVFVAATMIILVQWGMICLKITLLFDAPSAIEDSTNSLSFT